jgi:hypothetical protein
VPALFLPNLPNSAVDQTYLDSTTQ